MRSFVSTFRGRTHDSLHETPGMLENKKQQVTNATKNKDTALGSVSIAGVACTMTLAKIWMHDCMQFATNGHKCKASHDELTCIPYIMTGSAEHAVLMAGMYPAVETNYLTSRMITFSHRLQAGRRELSLELDLRI